MEDRGLALTLSVRLALCALCPGPSLAQDAPAPEGRPGVTRPADEGREGVTRPAKKDPHAEEHHHGPAGGGSAAPS